MGRLLISKGNTLTYFRGGKSLGILRNSKRFLEAKKIFKKNFEILESLVFLLTF